MLNKKIVNIVCSNFFYNGETLDIVPNPVFKVIIKNNLSNKKLLKKFHNRTFYKELHASIIKTPMDFFYKIHDFKAVI